MPRFEFDVLAVTNEVLITIYRVHLDHGWPAFDDDQVGVLRFAMQAAGIRFELPISGNELQIALKVHRVSMLALPRFVGANNDRVAGRDLPALRRCRQWQEEQCVDHNQADITAIRPPRGELR